MKKIIYCLSICIFTANNPLYSQSNKIDSLKSLLKVSIEDTSKVKNLIKLARKLETKEPYTADSLNLSALNLSEKLKWEYGKAESFLNIGSGHLNKGNLQLAMEYYLKALSIYERQNNAQRIADVNGNIGNICADQKEYEKAIEHYLKTTKFYENLGQKVSTAYGYLNIGSAYHELENSAKALEYYFMALPLVKEKKDTAMISLVLGNIANAYDDAGKGDPLEYYQEALKYAEYIRDKYSIARNLVNMSDYFFNTKRYQTARQYAEKSLTVAKEIGYKEVLLGNYTVLSALDSIEGNYKGAFENYKLQVIYQDSLLNEEIKDNNLKMTMQYEFDKKEAATKAEHDKKEALASAEIKRQKLIRNSTFGGVGLAGIFSFFIVLSYNRRKKTSFEKQVSEVEMKALRSQMNPHFIFNSLHSINKYMLDNDKQNASEFLSKFSKVMRLILENSREHEVPLEKDLAALELYMQLEALRFQNKFQYKIEIDPQIDKETTLIPPMILQPFVENSIIHGVRTKEDGMIKIKITKENDMIRCSVEDNGIGREESVKIEASEEKKHESLAMKITQERLNIISRLKKVKAAMNIFDLKNAENKAGGLRVELLLPFETAF